MRYDDPQRPRYDSGAVAYEMQVSGVPLPSITLVRPMESDGPDGAPRWGWLASIHAARGKNSFSHFYGWLGDLGQFQQDFMEDPEAALARYFKYKGPDKAELVAKESKGEIEMDLWETEPAA